VHQPRHETDGADLVDDEPLADGLTLAVFGRIPCAQVVVGGDLDMLTAPRLEQLLTELLHAGYRQVGVDFSGVTFFAAAGLNVICRATGHYREVEGQLRVAAFPRQIRHILDATGLIGDFNLQESTRFGAEFPLAHRVDGAGGSAMSDGHAPPAHRPGAERGVRSWHRARSCAGKEAPPRSGAALDGGD
jgi:anti-anti-sigma factor